MLKAAIAAAAEPGPDSAKRIHQRHLEAGIEDVIAGKAVMRQSLFADPRAATDVMVRDAAAAHAARLLTYAIAGAGAALVIAMTALAVALLK